MRVIKAKQVVEDAWQIADAQGPIPTTGDVLVGLQQWSDDAVRRAHKGRLGLVLRPGDDVMSVANIDQAELVAIEFPKFVDGRGYSMARLVRERLGYRGELRAVGNVLRDQLLYMQRCGFDAFALQPGKNADEAVSAFDELPVHYQAASDVAEPLFRRVARGV